MKHIPNVAYKKYIKPYIWKIYLYFIEYNNICTYLYNS